MKDLFQNAAKEFVIDQSPGFPTSLPFRDLGDRMVHVLHERLGTANTCP